MKKRNKQLLEEVSVQYHGSMEDLNYDDIMEFLESLSVDGILDEIEQDAYENLYYSGKCSPDEYTYVKESMKLWSEDEYFRRLSIIEGN